MILATSYPFLEVFWTMLVFFAFVVWLWLLFTVVFIILIPYFGVFVYVILEHNGMAERALKAQHAAQQQIDSYVKSVAGHGDPAEQISKAKQLLDSGTINAAEFEQIKQKALAPA